MFKIRSIAVRLILAIALTVAVACGIPGNFSILQQRALTRLAPEQQLSQAADQTRARADNELAATGQLGHQADALHESVDTFLAGLRDAA